MQLQAVWVGSKKLVILFRMFRETDSRCSVASFGQRGKRAVCLTRRWGVWTRWAILSPRRGVDVGQP